MSQRPMSQRPLRPTRTSPGWTLSLTLSLSILFLAGTASAQPFGSWVSFDGNPDNGYVRVAADSALNPTDAFTLEAWVSITNSGTGEDCRTIAGKNWQEAWWLGLCTIDGKPTLRSYLKGSASARNGGEIEPGIWTHVAVVFDGANRLHYINGELAASFEETGPLPTSTDELRIGSDVSWEFTPAGAIDEVRLWNVARTMDEIRDGLSVEISAAEDGLVGVWPFNGNASDVVGPHDGSAIGVAGFLTFAAAADCGANTPTSLCLLDRFQVTSRWRTDPAGTVTNGQAQVAGVANQGSGLFQFFGPDNWEILVKALNGCGVNGRYWVFSAATTNVFYRLDVTDVVGGKQKIYFNYPGPPAPAVTDVTAFLSCD